MFTGNHVSSIDVCKYVDMYRWIYSIYIYTHIYMYTCSICMYGYVYIGTCISVYICVDMFMCITCLWMDAGCYERDPFCFERGVSWSNSTYRRDSLTTDQSLSEYDIFHSLEALIPTWISALSNTQMEIYIRHIEISKIRFLGRGLHQCRTSA